MLAFLISVALGRWSFAHHQRSCCHCSYYPVQLSFEEAREVRVQDPERFKQLVQESLWYNSIVTPLFLNPFY